MSGGYFTKPRECDANCIASRETSAPKKTQVMQYAGLRSTRSKNRQKYKGCEYVLVWNGPVRKLTLAEIAEFRAGVELAIERASA